MLYSLELMSDDQKWIIYNYSNKYMDLICEQPMMVWEQSSKLDFSSNKFEKLVFKLN